MAEPATGGQRPTRSDPWSRGDFSAALRVAGDRGSADTLAREIVAQIERRRRIGGKKFALPPEGRTAAFWLSNAILALYAIVECVRIAIDPSQWASKAAMAALSLAWLLSRFRTPSARFAHELARAKDGWCVRCSRNLRNEPGVLTKLGATQDPLGPAACATCALDWPLLPRLPTERAALEAPWTASVTPYPGVMESPRIWTRRDIERRAKAALTAPDGGAEFAAQWRAQQRWRDAAGRSPVALHPPGTMTSRPGQYAPWPALVLLGVLLYLAIVLGSVAVSGSLWPIVFVGVVLVIAVTMAITRVHGYRQDAARVRLGRCAACGFSLAGLPALAPQPPWQTLGPETCPECGLHWPLLPRLRSERAGHVHKTS